MIVDRLPYLATESCSASRQEKALSGTVTQGEPASWH